MATDAVNKFTLKLFGQVAPRDDNCVISPLSVSVALQMCLVGARNLTAKQLQQLLCLDGIDWDLLAENKRLLDFLNKEISEQVSLEMANKLYAMKDFALSDEYARELVDSFGASIETVDFAAAEKTSAAINAWIEKKTNGKIRDVLDASSVNELTRLVLVNAIYFKGDWLFSFNKSLTRQENFTLANKQVVQVDMMSLKNRELLLQYKPKGLRCSTCQMPYKGGKLAMTIVLPDSGVGLDEIERTLNDENLTEIVAAKNKFYRLTNLYLPRFKTTYQATLGNVLATLGCPDPFDPKAADFGGIASEPGLFISNVIHKAYVEVNEKGTEAAAVTVVAVAKGASCSTASAPRAVEFRCNRPFLFVLHDVQRGTVLFIAKIVHPKP